MEILESGRILHQKGTDLNGWQKNHSQHFLCVEIMKILTNYIIIRLKSGTEERYIKLMISISFNERSGF